MFGILRSKNLNLKEHTASLLEMESGSNDPISYMLTVILTGLLTGASIRVPAMLFQQLFFGLIFGVLFGKGAGLGLKPPAVSDYRGKDHFCICRGCSCLCRSCAFGRKRVFKRVSLRNHYGKFFHAS